MILEISGSRELAAVILVRGGPAVVVGAGAAPAAGKTLNATVGDATAAVVRDVLKGNQALSALTQAQRVAAARFYRDVATRTTGQLAEAASKFNIARAEFLEGTRPSIPATLREFISMTGLSQ